MYTLRTRTLKRFYTTAGLDSAAKLEQVEAYLKLLDLKQAPEDVPRCMKDLHVDFAHGRFEVRWRDPEQPGGLSEESFIVTANGASQLAREVLPSRFWPGLKHLIRMDARGSELATLVWDKFAQHHETERCVRLCSVRVGTQVKRAVRAVVSKSYAKYSHLQLLADLLEGRPEFSDMPVLSWELTDTGFRACFCTVGIGTRVLSHMKPDLLERHPVPMVEVVNSEVGRSKVRMRGGLYKVHDQTSFSHWSDATELSWVHSGDMSRIRDGVRTGFTDLLEAANEVTAAYVKSAAVHVEDPSALLTDELKRQKATERAQESAADALSESKGTTLSAIVDAIGVAAKAEDDIYVRAEVETIAARTLKRGLDMAEEHNPGLLAILNAQS